MKSERASLPSSVEGRRPVRVASARALEKTGGPKSNGLIRTHPLMDLEDEEAGI